MRSVQALFRCQTFFILFSVGAFAQYGSYPSVPMFSPMASGVSSMGMGPGYANRVRPMGGGVDIMRPANIPPMGAHMGGMMGGPRYPPTAMMPGMYHRVLVTNEAADVEDNQRVNSIYNPARVLAAEPNSEANVETIFTPPDSAYAPVGQRRLQQRDFVPYSSVDQQQIANSAVNPISGVAATSADLAGHRSLQQTTSGGGSSASDSLLHELMLSTLRSEQGRAISSRIMNRLGLDADAIDLDALLNNPQVQEHAKRAMQDEDLRNLIFSILFATNPETLDANIDALINTVVSMTSS